MAGVDGGATDSPVAARRLTARLVVQVVPRASQTALVGRHGDALKIRIAAPPVDGAANAELVRFLSERLRVPRSAIAITAGQVSRRKVVSISGIDMATALKRLL